MNQECYIIRPNYKQKFRSSQVQELINNILKSKLSSITYNSDTCLAYSREIADEIKQKLKTLDYSRYKFVVDVVIGEVRGEGVKYFRF